MVNRPSIELKRSPGLTFRRSFVSKRKEWAEQAPVRSIVASKIRLDRMKLSIELFVRFAKFGLKVEIVYEE